MKKDREHDKEVPKLATASLANQNYPTGVRDTSLANQHDRINCTL